MTYRTAFYIALFTIAALVAAIFLWSRRNDPAVILKDDVLQQKRMEFISSAVSLGLITDVGQVDGEPYIVATERFLAADEEHQETLLDAVYSYYYDRRESQNRVLILDASEEQVGEYREGRVTYTDPKSLAPPETPGATV